MCPSEKKSVKNADLYARRFVNRDAIRSSYYIERAKRVVEGLERHGFAAEYVEDGEQAATRALELIPQGATVGVGGSMTLREIGLVSKLESLGHEVFDHWRSGLTPEQIAAIRRRQLTCDAFLTSVNALTLDGELVCCDGAGNRVAAMTFGPGKVIVIVGANKITNDVQSALRRVKEVVAPQALSDIGLEVPCVQTGVCQDCNSPARGCRVTLIMERKPYNTDISVLVAGRTLGF